MMPGQITQEEARARLQAQAMPREVEVLQSIDRRLERANKHLRNISWVAGFFFVIFLLSLVVGFVSYVSYTPRPVSTFTTVTR